MIIGMQAIFELSIDLQTRKESRELHGGIVLDRFRGPNNQDYYLVQEPNGDLYAVRPIDVQRVKETSAVNKPKATK
jgi:hypothetical protein